MNQSRQKKIQAILEESNPELIESKSFMLECSECCSLIYLFRTSIHPENHLFKSREKLAPIGPMLAYEFSSVKKMLTNPDMRAITEEDEEVYFPSMIHSQKNGRQDAKKKGDDFENDFNEGDHKINELPRLERHGEDPNGNFQNLELRK